MGRRWRCIDSALPPGVRDGTEHAVDGPEGLEQLLARYADQEARQLMLVSEPVYLFVNVSRNYLAITYYDAETSPQMSWVVPADPRAAASQTFLVDGHLATVGPERLFDRPTGLSVLRSILFDDRVPPEAELRPLTPA